MIRSWICSNSFNEQTQIYIFSGKPTHSEGSPPLCIVSVGMYEAIYSLETEMNEPRNP